MLSQVDDLRSCSPRGGARRGAWLRSARLRDATVSGRRRLCRRSRGSRCRSTAGSAASTCERCGGGRALGVARTLRAASSTRRCGAASRASHARVTAVQAVPVGELVSCAGLQLGLRRLRRLVVRKLVQVLVVDVRILRARAVSWRLCAHTLRAAPDTGNPLRAHKDAFPFVDVASCPRFRPWCGADNAAFTCLNEPRRSTFSGGARQCVWAPRVKHEQATHGSTLPAS